VKHSVRTTQQLALILQGCRKQAQLSQKKTSIKVGMLPKTISSLESNPDSCSIASLFKLLSALDLEMVLQPKQSTQDISDKDKW